MGHLKLLMEKKSSYEEESRKKVGDSLTMSYEDEKDFMKKQLDHRNVLKFLDSGKDTMYSKLKAGGTKSFIVSELALNGDLHEWS